MIHIDIRLIEMRNDLIVANRIDARNSTMRK